MAHFGKLVQITSRVPRPNNHIREAEAEADADEGGHGMSRETNFVGSSATAYHKLETKYAHVFVSRQKVAHGLVWKKRESHSRNITIILCQ